MPFNESPGVHTIDWLGVKVIITRLHISRHSVYDFACPKDTYIPYDLSVHFPKVSNLKAWWRRNNKISQTIPPKTHTHTHTHTESWWQCRTAQLWHSLISCSLMELPIATPNQDGASDFNVKGFSLLTRIPTTIEHLSLATCWLKRI